MSVTLTRAMAVAQTTPVRGDVEANLEEHLRLVDLAAEKGASTLLFPELSLTGYELDLAAELAFTETDSRLRPLISLAQTHGMTLIVGAPVRSGRRLHIGAFVLNPDRSVGLYTKHHLGAFHPSVSPDGVVPPAEQTVFDAGTHNPLISAGGRHAAVAICADTSKVSHPAIAAKRGAKTYLASMFFTPSEAEKENSRMRAYAIRHSMVVVMANYGGPSGGLEAGGGSAIWSVRGELVAQLDSVGSGVAVSPP